MYSVSADAGPSGFIFAVSIESAIEASRVARECRSKRLHHVIVKDEAGRVLTETDLSSLARTARDRAAD